MSYDTRADKREGMAFDIDLQGHIIRVDASEQFGGVNYGPTPKYLMLSALAGCTAMDVVSILGKMQMPYDSFAIEVDGVTADEHPKVFTEVSIRYIFTGSELDETKIEKAASLSLNKYCAVAATLKHTATVHHEIVINR